MANTAKPFKYRGKWRAQLKLENGVRVTRDFAPGQHDEAVRWLAEQRANADPAHEPHLGGPTQATLAQALNLYAHCRFPRKTDPAVSSRSDPPVYARVDLPA